jgi:hypothetical protein
VHRPQLVAWNINWPLPAESGSTRWEKQIAALCIMQQRFTGGKQGEVGIAADIRAKWSGYSPESSLWIGGTYAGTVAQAEAALKPLLDVAGGEKSIDLLRSSHQTSRMLADDPLPAIAGATPMPTHRKSRFVSRTLDPDDWRRIIDQLLTSPTPYSEFQIHCYGGAIGAYPREKSAFVHRTTSFCCYLLARWRNPSQQPLAEAYLDDWCAVMEPYWDGGIYQNFPSEDYEQYRSNYWGAAFPTLLKVKRKYDPRGLFAFPQMVNSAERAPVVWPPLVAKALGEEIQDTA